MGRRRGADRGGTATGAALHSSNPLRRPSPHAGDNDAPTSLQECCPLTHNSMSSCFLTASINLYVPTRFMSAGTCQARKSYTIDRQCPTVWCGHSCSDSHREQKVWTGLVFMLHTHKSNERSCLPMLVGMVFVSRLRVSGRPDCLLPKTEHSESG